MARVETAVVSTVGIEEATEKPVVLTLVTEDPRVNPVALATEKAPRVAAPIFPSISIKPEALKERLGAPVMQLALVFANWIPPEAALMLDGAVRVVDMVEAGAKEFV